MALTVPVSALDRKRPDDQATAAAVAANQRVTGLEAVKSPGELTVFIDNMLADLEARFDEMSQDVITRMNAMGDRIDTIETSIQDIINADDAAPKHATGTGKTANAARNSPTNSSLPEGGNNSASDDFLMHTAPPEGVSDDSSSTIGAGKA
ncbi:hypothetical protein QFC22_000150 [Naganishia vaughanmartiniae]|uniref:Uncharacterized protein n=1 Tax=Naganishia vaughanmartiniae TaxID=1424756 RepID=A0ACC2XNJ3_9TREE|nr:hypothetical protein QFC22_000150 [Naganishia vaughanmartiniae]